MKCCCLWITIILNIQHKNIRWRKNVGKLAVAGWWLSVEIWSIQTYAEGLFSEAMTKTTKLQSNRQVLSARSISAINSLVENWVVVHCTV